MECGTGTRATSTAGAGARRAALASAATRRRRTVRADVARSAAPATDGIDPRRHQGVSWSSLRGALMIRIRRDVLVLSLLPALVLGCQVIAGVTGLEFDGPG